MLTAVVRDALKVAEWGCRRQPDSSESLAAIGRRAGEREDGCQDGLHSGRCCLPVSDALTQCGICRRKRIDREIQCLGGLFCHVREAPQRGSAPRRWPGVVIRRSSSMESVLSLAVLSGRPRWKLFSRASRLRAWDRRAGDVEKRMRNGDGRRRGGKGPKKCGLEHDAHNAEDDKHDRRADDVEGSGGRRRRALRSCLRRWKRALRSRTCRCSGP